MPVMWNSCLCLIDPFYKAFSNWNCFGDKIELPAKDCNSQLVAFLCLIILETICAMSCSLSFGILMTILLVSIVRPKNSTTMEGPSDFSGAIGICI